jgi:hypothetical protein
MVAVIPVSDPNSSTMAQRIMQYQAVMQMAQAAPQIYDLPQLHRQMIAVLGVKNGDKLVPLPDDMKPKDPITENMALLNGKPTKAFMYQDHDAHMAVHQSLVQDPLTAAQIGQSPNAQAIQAAIMAHNMEHAAFKYRAMVEQQLGVPLPDPDEEMDPQVEVQVSQLVAQAAQQMVAQNKGQAAQQQAQQQMQDPLIQMQQQELQIKQQEAQTKAQKVHGDLAIKQQELQLKAAQAHTQAQTAAASAPNPVIENLAKVQDMQHKDEMHQADLHNKQTLAGANMFQQLHNHMENVKQQQETHDQSMRTQQANAIQNVVHKHQDHELNLQTKAAQANAQLQAQQNPPEGD